MLQDRIALRYAKALYEDAKAKGKLAEVLEDQRGMQRLLKESREFRTFLQSPILSNARKRAIIRVLFKDRLHDLTEEFYEFLTLRGREEMIPYIANEYVTRYNHEHNIQPAKVTTAVPLSETQRSQVLTKLTQQTGKTIELTEVVNPNVIGGMAVLVGDLQLDNTLAATLLRARKRLAKTS